MFYGALDHAALSPYANIEDPEILSKGRYINCGVLLINLKTCREFSMTSKALSYIDRKSTDIRVADQSVINDLFRDHIELVDVTYNYYSVLHYPKFLGTRLVLGEMVEYCGLSTADIRVIHYVGHWYERPWNRDSIAFYSKEYLSYVPAELRSEVTAPFRHSGILDFYDVLMHRLRVLGMLKLEFSIRYLVVQKLRNYIKKRR